MNVRIRYSRSFVIGNHFILWNIFNALSSGFSGKRSHDRALRRPFVAVEIILREFHDIVVRNFVVRLLFILQFLKFALHSTFASLFSFHRRLLRLWYLLLLLRLIMTVLLLLRYRLMVIVMQMVIIRVPGLRPGWRATSDRFFHDLVVRYRRR